MYSAHPPSIHIITPLIKPYADTLLYDLFVWTVIQQIWSTPAATQLWNALMKRKSLRLSTLHFELMWKRVVMEFRCFAATVWLCPADLAFVLQIWPEGFWTVCWMRGVPTWKVKTNFESWNRPKKRKAPLDGDGEEEDLWPVLPEETGENLGGNLTVYHIWNSLSPSSITTQNPNHPPSPPSGPELGWTQQLLKAQSARCIHGNDCLHP